MGQGAFFSHARGTVTRVAGTPWTRVADFSVRADFLPIGGTIVTQAGIQQAGNFQFLHTLNDAIFVYVFGDRIAQLRISGFAFADDCDKLNGMFNVLSSYDRLKISNQARPITVNYGGESFECFVTGMHISVDDPEFLRGQWTFVLHSFPTT